MNRRRRTDEPVKNIHRETEYHTVVTDDGTQDEGFNCKACGKFITVKAGQITATTALTACQAYTLTIYPATAQPIAAELWSLSAFMSVRTANGR